MSGNFHLPSIQQVRAVPQFPCPVPVQGGCSDYWVPAGPAEDTFVATIFTDEQAEFSDIQSATPRIDFTDSPLTPNLIQPFTTSNNFQITSTIGQAAYSEVQYMLANNFWGCDFSYGNSPCGVQVRQGVAHMIDRASFAASELSLSGQAFALDSPNPADNVGSLPPANPCAWDSMFPESGPSCIVGAPGGTAYHLANATGANGIPWLQAPGSADLNAAAAHFVAAGIATGYDQTTSVLAGIKAAAAQHVPNFFIRNDNPALLDLGDSVSEQICYIFTGTHNFPCTYLSVTHGPISAFPGFTTSTTGVNYSWGIYTAAYNNPTGALPFDSTYYFTYNSHFVSGAPALNGPSRCDSTALPSASARNYMYACVPAYDSVSSQMEFASCPSRAGDPTINQATPTFANCPGTSNVCFPSLIPCLDLQGPTAAGHGGVVMHNPTDYLIFWLPPGYYYDNVKGDSFYEQLLIRYFKDICLPNPLYSILSQYADNSGPPGPCSFGGSWVDNSAYPILATLNFTDADIRAEVSNAMTMNGWVANNGNNEFFVFTAYGLTSYRSLDFCAYHYFFPATNGPVIYSFMPDVGSIGGCTEPAIGSSPNGDFLADAEIDAASHEQFESVTDPQLNAWYYLDLSHEIGDECAFIFSTSSGSTLTVNGDQYQVQLEWDNSIHACASTPGFGFYSLTAVSYGYLTENLFGQLGLTLPVFGRNAQFGLLNNGWIRVINNVGTGLPNYFTWLNAWNPNPVSPATIRQGFKQTTSSVSPFIESTVWDAYIDSGIYDSLTVPPTQLIDWMTLYIVQFDNSMLTYTPPQGTVASFRITLRDDMFFQDGTKVTAFDVAFSYLALTGAGAFVSGGAAPMTGITILGPRQLDINVNAVGFFTQYSLTTLPIIPGAYWSSISSKWNRIISTCTATGASCYPAQYTINPRSPLSTICVLTCPQGFNQIMNVDPSKTSATYDPIRAGTLIGSGAWQCGSGTLTNASGNCSSSGAMNPPVGGNYILTRFGAGLAPGSSIPNIYFRSNGNLALYLWSQDNGVIVHDFLNFAVAASCFGAGVTSSAPCAHFQQGIGGLSQYAWAGNGNTFGSPQSVGFAQVAIVNRFVGLNWIAPFNWVSNPPLGIIPLVPVLYEGATTLNPSSVTACPDGYDC